MTHEFPLAFGRTASPAVAAALEAEVNLHHERRDFVRALQRQQQATRAWEDAGDAQRLANALQSEGYLEFRLGRHGAALKSYERALALRQTLDDKRGIAALRSRQAEVHQRCGDHILAVEALEASLALCGEDEDRHPVGVVLNNLGVSYAELGEREMAIVSYAKALRIRRALGDMDGLATTLLNLGSLYLIEGNEQARALLEEAHAIRLSLNDMAGLSRIALALGRLHELGGDVGQAQAHYDRAWELSVAPEVSAADVEAAALHCLGLIALRREDAAGALRMFVQARCLAAQSGKKEELARNFYQCGNAHKLLGEWCDAMRCFGAAQAIQERIGDHAGLAETRAAIAEIRTESNMHATAYDALTIAIQLQAMLSDHPTRTLALHLMEKLGRLQGSLDKATGIARSPARDAARPGEAP